MTGPLTCPLHNGLRMVAQPTNEVISMVGVAYCSLNEKFQIVDLEIYFDQNEPMNSMVKVGGSPLGLPAKGKTIGGVDVELKPPSSAQASAERKRVITRTDSRSSSFSEAMVTARGQLEKQFSAPSEDEPGNSIWGGIKGWLGK